MFVVWLVVVFGVLFGIAVLAMGRGGGLRPVDPDRIEPDLPESRALSSRDVELLRLPVGLRGYRMREVDEVLDRLAAELAGRDREIARLEAGLRASPQPFLAPRSEGPNSPPASAIPSDSE
jgi:DivIVA domain-containing protein